MKNNNVITAVAISLVIILIGGAVALVLMLGGNKIDGKPTDYVAKDCGAFVQFDLGLNAGELLDQIRPLTKMYQAMLDDTFSDISEYDASFIDLAGFFVMNSSNVLDEEYVFGIRLSGKGNPQKGVEELFGLINESVPGEIKIEKDEDGFTRIEDEIVMYIDDSYILFSQDVGSIQGALAVKDGKREGITESNDWNAIKTNMESEKFSFFLQIVPDFYTLSGKEDKDKESVVIVGSGYEGTDVGGLEITLVGGRPRLKRVLGNEYETDEMLMNADKLFDNACDLSGIISKLPSETIRAAIPAVPNISGDWDWIGLLLDGKTGFWAGFDRSGDFNDMNLGIIFEPDDMTKDELMDKLFPADEYSVEEVYGGKIVTTDDLIFSDKVYVKDDPDDLIISMNERILDERIESSRVEPTDNLAFFMTMDYSWLISEMMDEDMGDNPFMAFSSMWTELIREANLVFNIRAFEENQDIKLQFELTGDFEKLNKLGESLLPGLGN